MEGSREGTEGNVEQAYVIQMAVEGACPAVNRLVFGLESTESRQGFFKTSLSSGSLQCLNE